MQRWEGEVVTARILAAVASPALVASPPFTLSCLPHSNQHSSLKMGKTGKALKRRKIASALATATLTPPSDNLDSEDEGGSNDPGFLLGLVSPVELAVSVKTLQTLTTHAEAVKGKAETKALRGAVFDYQRVSAAVTGTGGIT